MFYVKVEETNSHPGELILADSDALRWSRQWIEVNSTDRNDFDLLAEVSLALREKLGLTFSVAHVGDATPNHDSGFTANWVHWLNPHLVGYLVVSTSPIYLLGENGKTIDRV